MIHIRKKTIDGKVVEVGDSIRATKWSALNTFFEFLVKKKYISVNPVSQTDRPRMKTKNKVVYMTQEEVKSVFERIEKESAKRLKNRDICIVALGLCTGLRVSAIVNIDVEDINFHTNIIRVVEKGKKTRDIPFAENFRNVLLIWLKDRELYFDGEVNAGPLFMSTKKQRLSVDGVEEMIKKYTSHLSKHITPHKLRSSAAMNLYSSNVGVLTIASLLGHENITTTQRYISAFDEEKENATNILDSMF
jgi:site-specific recombinase XerD